MCNNSAERAASRTSTSSSGKEIAARRDSSPVIAFNAAGPCLPSARDTESPENRRGSTDAFERAEHDALHLAVEHRNHGERERLDLKIELRISKREAVAGEEL